MILDLELRWSKRILWIKPRAEEKIVKYRGYEKTLKRGGLLTSSTLDENGQLIPQNFDMLGTGRSGLKSFGSQFDTSSSGDVLYDGLSHTSGSIDEEAEMLILPK